MNPVSFKFEFYPSLGFRWMSLELALFARVVMRVKHVKQHKGDMHECMSMANDCDQTGRVYHPKCALVRESPHNTLI